MLNVKSRFDHFLLKSKVRWKMPFTALMKATRLINIKDGTILDAGCGRGFPGSLFNKKGHFNMIGVDIHKPYLIQAKNYRIFSDLILADLRKSLPFKDRTFEIVVCIEVIEHLKKNEASNLIQELERVSKNKVIITTPVGFTEHPFEDENPFSIHLSSWYPYELRKKGYVVRGTTLKLGNRARVFPVHLLSYMLSILFAPLAHLYPELSYGMVAVKIIGEQKT